jgi:hypothetical protein
MLHDLSPLAELAPESCGDFDLRIDRAGVWHYRGSPIGRPSLVKLFARVRRREADGSLGVCDSKGAMRAMPLDTVEVKDRGPRGGVMWVPLTEWAERTEQLKLL